MAPIFAQMQGDEVGTRFFGAACGLDRIGVIRVPLLAQRSDVINIHAQLYHGKPPKTTIIGFFGAMSIYAPLRGPPEPSDDTAYAAYRGA